MATGEQRRRRVYVDTSAYISLLLMQKGHKRVAAETGDATRLSSVLLLLESRRTLVRLGREGALSSEEYEVALERIDRDAGLFVLRDVTRDLCDAAPMTAVPTPRSLDLAHLRTALWFHSAEPIDRFVTLDVGQRQAAKELGLPV